MRWVDNLLHLYTDQWVRTHPLDFLTDRGKAIETLIVVSEIDRHDVRLTPVDAREPSETRTGQQVHAHLPGQFLDRYHRVAPPLLPARDVTGATTDGDILLVAMTTRSIRATALPLLDAKENGRFDERGWGVRATLGRQRLIVGRVACLLTECHPRAFGEAIARELEIRRTPHEQRGFDDC